MLEAAQAAQVSNSLSFPTPPATLPETKQGSGRAHPGSAGVTIPEVLQQGPEGEAGLSGKWYSSTC